MLTLLHLLSAVALLVWGTHIVRTGVMRVFGARLRTVLSRSVEKKPLAFCAGIGVTALVQSSNATTMLVTSFVAQDLVALAPALQPIYSAPRFTTSVMGASSPRSRHCFSNWKVLPPPTITISAFSIAATGSTTL